MFFIAAKLQIVYMLFTLGAYLFISGLTALAFFRRNFILVMLALEVLLLSLSLYFTLYSVLLTNLYGQIVTLVLLALAGSESALGLALIMLFYHLHNNINISSAQLLKS